MTGRGSWAQRRPRTRSTSTTATTSTAITTTTQIHSGPIGGPLHHAAAFGRDLATPAALWPRSGLPVGTGGGLAWSPQRRATPAPTRPLLPRCAQSGTPVPFGTPFGRLGTPFGRPFRPRGPRHVEGGDRQARPEGVVMRHHVQGTVYLLHFTEPYRHAKHYTLGGEPPSQARLAHRGSRRAAGGGRHRARHRLCAGAYLGRGSVSGAGAQAPPHGPALLPHLPRAASPP
jgi:hypothetical protein